MVEARGIETLSLSFTAGVIAGTILPGGSPVAFSLLLSAILFPCFFPSLIARIPGAGGRAVMTAVFLGLGIFCAWNAAIPGISSETLVEDLARDAALRLRQLIDRLSFPTEGTAPLLKALLTGDRSGLSRETTAVFRRSGASHILALSGLHIGIIYLLFDKLSRVLGRSAPVRRLRFVLMILGAGFFTLMTGAGPSIVRAFLFILINETLQLLHRPRNSVRVLCLALLVQLVLSPQVIRSVGFQLSYLAMAGIFLLYPVMEKWYPQGSRWDPVRKIWTMAALSISCQVFTAPLAWLRFHSFPRFFLLCNLLALPITTALITAATGTVILGAIGWCPPLLIKATDGLCRLLVWVLEIISSL